jgi:calcineurin-like phosphoesterase family protein
MNYYISDLHFGHKNIIRFDNRPFADIKEMEEKIIDNWNSVVKAGDTVYHLGDFCWGKTDEWERILKLLKGNKVIIQGNHDLKQYPPSVRRLLADVKDYKEIKEEDKTVIMSHYPIMTYKHSYDPNVFMFYGHVHSHTNEAIWVKRWITELQDTCHGIPDNRGQLINVGCMQPYMDYTPQTLTYLTDKFYKGELIK